MEPKATAAPTSPMTTWPGAFGAFKPSRKIVMFNLAPVLLLFVVSFLVGVLKPNHALGSLAALVVTSVLSVGTISTLFEARKGVKLSVSDAVTRGFSLLAIKYLALAIVLTFILIGSALLFIIPFFFVLPRVVLAPYILVDTNGGIFDSVQKSWDLTKGSAGKSWGIIGVSLLFTILCVVLVGLYLLLMYAAVFVLFYEYVQAKHGATVSATTVPEVAAPSEPTAPAAPVQ